MLDRRVEPEGDLRHLPELDPVPELAADEPGGAVEAFEGGLLLLFGAQDTHVDPGERQVANHHG